MLNRLTARFNGRMKTNKTHKSLAEEYYNIISTGKIKEVDILRLGRFPVLQDDKSHATTDITFTGESRN